MSTLELYWATSSESSSSSKELSLSPTKYEEYPSKNNKDSLMNVQFSKGPLIEIDGFTDNELYEDELISMQSIYQSYIDKEKQCLMHSKKFIKTFGVTEQHFIIYNSNIMRISWTMCQSRRVFQQGLQYFQRYLSSIKASQISLKNIDLLGCVCLRLASKHNMCRYERNKIQRDDSKPKYYLQLLRTQYNVQALNKLEYNVLRTLQFELNYPTIYDFVLHELEMLLLKIPHPHRTYYQSIYLKPSVLLKMFQIIDFILLDIESVSFKPSLIASGVLKCCFDFENWQQGLLNITKTNKHKTINYMPKLQTPTPTPTPSPFVLTPGSYAKLGGQIHKQEEFAKCIKLVTKYMTVQMRYWEPPKQIFDYKKTLTNNILTYQTWRAMH